MAKPHCDTPIVCVCVGLLTLCDHEDGSLCTRVLIFENLTRNPTQSMASRQQ